MSTNGVAPPRRHAAGPAMVLGLSGLDERARALAATAAASLSIAKLEPKDASTATHVVAPTVRRSLKILHAAARGAWILSPAWLDDSAAVGHTLPPCDYELSGARAARLRRPPGGALAGLEVTLCAGLPLATRELRSLLRAAGADVAPTVRAESEGVRCARGGDTQAGVGYDELLDGILAGGLTVPPRGAALSTRPEGDATAGPVADVPAGHRLQFVTSAPARKPPGKSPRGAPADRRAKRRRAAASADAAAEPTEAEAFYARDAALSLYRDRLPDCNVDCAAGPRGWHDFLGGLSEQGTTAVLWRESKGAEPVAVGACTFLVHADAGVAELLLLATRRGHGRRGLGSFLVNAVNRRAASEFGVTVSATPAAADAEGFWAKQGYACDVALEPATWAVLTDPFDGARVLLRRLGGGI